MSSDAIRVERHPGYWLGRFECMASPCEIMVASEDETLARRVIAAIGHEARRIEKSFSRYRKDNIIHRINTANGKALQVNEELAALLDFAASCWKLSDGMFDITSGILRRAWRFDGQAAVPDPALIEKLLPLVGWEKVSWKHRELQLLPGMEIDLGGIGKEYAVDRAADIAVQHSDAGVLVNFGGDIRATGPRSDTQAWRVGIEALDVPEQRHAGVPVIALKRGAIATSGDARRYVLLDGERLGHILDPRSGWPVRQAPRSVTVLDDSCIQAGLLATLAMLKGDSAEHFLESQGVDYRIFR